MQINLVDQNRDILANELLQATLRTDLVPIPVSLEFSVISNDFLKQNLIEGTLIQVGDLNIELSIVKVQRIETQTIKDGQRVGAIACVATPTGCDSLLVPLKKAIDLNETSFNMAYRASGAKFSLGMDLPLPKFICLKGTLATTRIARYLQQEGAVIAFQKDRISAIKIDQLFKQDVIAKFDPSAIAWIDSNKVQNLQKSSYLAVDADGVTVLGENTVAGQSIRQVAGLDSRQLKNMSKILFKKGEITRPLNTQLNAGHVVEISSKKYVILTAAHFIDTGVMGTAPSAITKLWLASL